MSGYAIVDIETTGLSPFRHEIWEVGYILEPEGIEVEFALPVDATVADPKALEVNRFHQRHFSGDVPEMVLPQTGARAIARDWRDRSILAQPALFDLTFVRCLLHQQGVAETWSHRAVHDLKTYALGRRGTGVENLSGSQLAALYDVPQPADAHRALADARWARDLARAMGAIA